MNDGSDDDGHNDYSNNLFNSYGAKQTKKQME